MHTKKRLLLSSGLYRRFRNHTESAVLPRVADYTAGRESHPTPKIIIYKIYF